MTGEAPWMGVTPQPPSESEPHVIRHTGMIEPEWTEGDIGAIMVRTIADLIVAALAEGIDPKAGRVHYTIALEVPWAG